MIPFWLPVVSAASYRVRGSKWTGHDSRLKGLRVVKLAIGAAPVAAACVLLGVPPLYAIGVLLITSAADSLPHSEWQGTTSGKQVLMMSVVGLAAAIPAATALALIWNPTSAALAAACGVLTGPATWIGNKIPLNFHIGPIGFNQGPEWGEVMRGFVRVLFML